MEATMKRILGGLLLVGLAGCMDFREYYVEDPVVYHYAPEYGSPCQQATGVTTSTQRVPSGVIPAGAQIPVSSQTREPDLLTPAR